MVAAGAGFSASHPGVAADERASTTRSLADVFDREVDEGARWLAAEALLRAQLEPAPPTLPAREPSDPDYCAPPPDLGPLRIPAARRAVDRLLEPRCVCALRVVGWGRRGEFWTPFQEWGRSLASPSDRVTFWRRVLEATAGGSQPVQELVRSLAGLAHERVASDGGAGLRLLDEAIELSGAMEEWTAQTETLRAMRQRALRLAAGHRNSAAGLHDVVGTYTWSGAVSGGTLVLAADGTYIEETLGDAMDLCDGGRSLSTGSYVVEDRYVVLHRPMGPLDPRGSVFAAIPWGGRMYLVTEHEEEMREFCRQVTAGTLQSTGRWSWGRVRGANLPVTGLPAVPAAWKELVVPPLEVRVIDVSGDQALVIDAGSVEGLRPGMWIYGHEHATGSAGGWWLCTYVLDHVAVGLPSNRSNTAQVGDRLCTAMVPW